MWKVCQSSRNRRKQTEYQNKWWKLRRETKAPKDRNFRKPFNKEVQKAVKKDKKKYYNNYKDNKDEKRHETQRKSRSLNAEKGISDLRLES